MGNIMKVYYGSDNLPYKDKERTVHYPIVGNAFSGASLTTEIRFYVDEVISGDIIWVANAKRPDGKIAYKQLERFLDEDINEHYVSLSLSQWFLEKKGDLYISLNGYSGGVDISVDEESGIYYVSGEPVISATGSIKISISYAVQMNSGYGSVPTIDVQQALALFAEKSYGYIDLSQQISGTLTEEQFTEAQKRLCIIKDPYGLVYVKYKTDNDYIIFRNLAQQYWDSETCEYSDNFIKVNISTKEYNLVEDYINLLSREYVITELNKKQYKLTAGLNIVITDNNIIKTTVHAIYETIQVGGATGTAGLYVNSLGDAGFVYSDSTNSSDIRIIQGVPELVNQSENYKTTFRVGTNGIYVEKKDYINDTTTGFDLFDLFNGSIGYIELSGNSGTLTEEQLVEVQKKFCVIKYTGHYTRLLVKYSFSSNTITFKDEDIYGGTTAITSEEQQIVINTDTRSWEYSLYLRYSYSRGTVDTFVQDLQNQIDTIVAASDVVDIVGTYQDLQNYDTSSLTDKDIIKVLSDSTHNNATSYYRWTNNTWTYIGSEGPYYTKSETNNLLDNKVDKSSTGNALYGTLDQGSGIIQAMYNIGLNPIGYGIVQRDSSGGILVQLTPTESNHATSKYYVDNAVNNTLTRQETLNILNGN